MSGVAAPVFDAGGRPLAAICMTLEEETPHPRRLVEIPAAVRGAARHLGAALARRSRDDGGALRRLA